MINLYIDVSKANIEEIDKINKIIEILEKNEKNQKDIMEMNAILLETINDFFVVFDDKKIVKNNSIQINTKQINTKKLYKIK